MGKTSDAGQANVKRRKVKNLLFAVWGIIMASVGIQMRHGLPSLVFAAVLTSLISVRPATAQSDYWSVQRLLPACRSGLTSAISEADDIGGFRRGICAGYIGTVMYYGAVLNADYRFCPPKVLQVGVALLMLVEYLEHHPEFAAKDLRSVAIGYFQQEWPCPPQ